MPTDQESKDFRLMHTWEKIDSGTIQCEVLLVHLLELSLLTFIEAEALDATAGNVQETNRLRNRKLGQPCGPQPTETLKSAKPWLSALFRFLM
jgi:hypothetical protein